ncbi:hypothetical protein NQ314_019470 [Rhamnusium bicolor]|uniref:Uncharacterized protein n=1 Tax=Rhamnusium bicolor TaxID=1586634 RepID=A0AAV8WND9_9CUCU|nr:hypothetical protein NQ314_019470 [Rhamnusium bicolor]
MRANNISDVAKNDPVICLYGESLLAKHKRQQIANVVSNKIKEMARLLMTIISMDGDISNFFDVLRFEMFGTLLSATKIISGYDDQNKSFKAPF